MKEDVVIFSVIDVNKVKTVLCTEVCYINTFIFLFIIKFISKLREYVIARNFENVTFIIYTIGSSSLKQ